MRVLSVCRYLPDPGSPAAGGFVFERLAAMAALTPVTILQPVPYFPVLRPLPGWAREPGHEHGGRRIERGSERLRTAGQWRADLDTGAQPRATVAERTRLEGRGTHRARRLQPCRDQDVLGDGDDLGLRVSDAQRAGADAAAGEHERTGSDRGPPRRRAGFPAETRRSTEHHRPPMRAGSRPSQEQQRTGRA